MRACGRRPPSSPGLSPLSLLPTLPSLTRAPPSPLPPPERLSGAEWTCAGIAGVGVVGLGLSAEPDHMDHPEAPALHIVGMFLVLVAIVGAECWWRHVHLLAHTPGPGGRGKPGPGGGSVPTLGGGLLPGAAGAGGGGGGGATPSSSNAAATDAALCGLEAGACFGLSAAACRTGFILGAKVCSCVRVRAFACVRCRVLPCVRACVRATPGCFHSSLPTPSSPPAVLHVRPPRPRLVRHPH
jgi:hypothetical protein